MEANVIIGYYRAISGEHIRFERRFNGDRAEAVRTLKESFKGSLTPLVRVDEEEIPLPKGLMTKRQVAAYVKREKRGLPPQ